MYGYNQTMHKVFISFYHHDDQIFKDYIDTNLCGKIINKSVMLGEYDSDNSDEYIKRLIREEKISDSSVIVVLIGKNTKNRKHVDWEIYAGLSASINGSAGLIGIMLPTVQKNIYGNYNYDDMPSRFADNLKTGYASLYECEYAIKNFEYIIDQAFQSRRTKHKLINNTRIQMKYNR